MEILILLIILYFKGMILEKTREFIFLKLHYVDELLFYFSYSLNPKDYEFITIQWIYRLYQFLISLLISSALCRYFGISIQIVVVFALIVFLIILFSISSVVEKNKSRLINDLSRFVFIYELYLIQGENQLQALNKAAVSIQAMGPARSVEEHWENFQKLFSYTKWLVVKRIVILLERGMHFTQMDMSMDFVQISDELFRRSYQDRKLRSEKLENLMLLPMVGDLLVMVLYIVSPFLGVIIGG
ncbi:MAG: hypothetical protein GX046_04335 [Tissierellia bacterium]|nr:hypothetical protein [Tissierellia bacterium]